MTKKVMIIDDNKEFSEELKETLELSGYEVCEVNDAVIALETASKVNPDVILLDLKMPEKSGFQVAYEFKHFSELMHIPIIAMTGFVNDQHLAFMKIYGIKKCLNKPFSPLDAIAQIEEVIVREEKIEH
jgi:CheY-like chemotaxis protein